MPKEKLGVIVFAIGDHAAPLYNPITYNIYERLLGLDETPWTNRLLDQRLKSKKADTEARAKAGSDRVPNTKPSHALDDFVGDYEHPAYGTLRISRAGEGLQFEFHKLKMPLAHFHYDRFDTPNDEQFGSFSVNFRTNPQGDIDTAVISLDEAEAAFIRKPDRLGPEMLAKLAGTYALPTGQTFTLGSPVCSVFVKAK